MYRLSLCNWDKRRWRERWRDTRLRLPAAAGAARGGRRRPCTWRGTRRAAAPHRPRSPAASASARPPATPVRTRTAAGYPPLSTHLPVHKRELHRLRDSTSSRKVSSGVLRIKTHYEELPVSLCGERLGKF